MQPSRVSFVLCTCFLIASVAGTAQAQSSIDGVWAGTYTSTSSPEPTQETLMFETIDDQVVGVYLSRSGSAGILDGLAFGNTYALGVTQPVAGCPTPATGVFLATVDGDQMTYSFRAESCEGSDGGEGTAIRGAAEGTPSSALEGLWDGEYTSTLSPDPTHEKLLFESFGANVVGVYLSESGATGILTGPVTGDIFTLHDNAPSPPCPSEGTFSGHLDGAQLSYSFSGVSCNGQSDQGKGTATKLEP